jgi:aminopeptidase
MSAIKTVIMQLAKLLPGLYLGLRPGQPVFVQAGKSHELFLNLIVRELGRSGADEIMVHMVDPNHRSLAQMQLIQKELCQKSMELGASYVRIAGPEGPGFYAGLSPDERHILDLLILRPVGEYRRQIMAGLIPRCILPGPTAEWGKLVYPGIPPQEAAAQLAGDIARFCFLDHDNPEASFLAFDESLEQARQWLQDLTVRSLHLEGGGANLRIQLSPQAIWLAGRKWTPGGRRFYANVPIGEVFTTPLAAATEGTVRITMPTMAAGTEVVGLTLQFSGGRLVGFTADQGARSFRDFLETDPEDGSLYLGEIALVSMDSPLCAGETLYREILVDEKRRSHIALGEGYTNTIVGGPTMSPEELRQNGVNKSSLHHDLMIGSVELDITADTYDGRSVPVMSQGRWTFR